MPACKAPRQTGSGNPKPGDKQGRDLGQGYRHGDVSACLQAGVDDLCHGIIRSDRTLASRNIFSKGFGAGKKTNQFR
jgi:hypothetical protein